MDPMLIDVPTRLETPRLVLRCPQPGDGPLLHAMQCETVEELRPWMPWAQATPTPDESEVYCRRMQARFLLREDLVMFVFERDVQGRQARLVASTGLHRMDWTLRGFEIGYWRRRGCGGRGLVTEAVTAISRMAFDRLDARRVEIRADDSNRSSWALAERAGFTLEALLRGDSLTPQGEPRSTRVYARVRGVEEPAQ